MHASVRFRLLRDICFNQWLFYSYRSLKWLRFAKQRGKILDSYCEVAPRRHAHGYWLTSETPRHVEDYVSRQVQTSLRGI